MTPGRAVASARVCIDISSYPDRKITRRITSSLAIKASLMKAPVTAIIMKALVTAIMILQHLASSACKARARVRVAFKRLSEGQGSLQSLSEGPISLYTAACNSLPDHVRAGDAAQAYLAKVKVRLCSCQTGYNQGKMIIWPTIHGLRMVELVLMCNALVLLALSCAQAFSNALSRAPM